MVAVTAVGWPRIWEGGRGQLRDNREKVIAVIGEKLTGWGQKVAEVTCQL